MGGHTLVALSIKGEVDHHDRVLLHDADQQDDADDRDHAQVIAAENQRQQGADGRRRQGREDGDRVDVALIEHTQHDVHGHHRRQDQQQGARQRRLERLCSALELGLHANRHADVFLHLINQFDRLPQRYAGRQVERDHHRRELPDVGNGQLRLTLFNPGQAGQPDLTAIRGFYVDLLQRLRADFLAIFGLQYHAVLAGLGVDGRNLPLAEGVVQCVRDVRYRHPEARRGIAVDDQKHLQAFVLQVAGDIGQFWLVTQGRHQFLAPGTEQLRIRR